MGGPLWLVLFSFCVLFGLFSLSLRPSVHPTMGCTRSRIEPLIYESDEKQFLANWSNCKSDNHIFTRQSSSDFSFVKVGSKGNSNNGSNSCPSDHWYDEIPELLILLLLFLFALTLYRKWQAKKRTKATRRALGFGQQSLPNMALQTVSSHGGDLSWRGRMLDAWTDIPTLCT